MYESNPAKFSRKAKVKAVVQTILAYAFILACCGATVAVAVMAPW